ncbi:MAG: hypothetical protein E6R13_06255 [Spirochaetes bacterium]|nr:MAG: hypothetical protein E6R13_06255 [Spirochaetota bacterium]
MKEIIKPYVRLSIYELACKISETYPEGFLVKIDNEEDFLMIQYLLRSDTLGQHSELDFEYYSRKGQFHLGVLMSPLDIYKEDGSDNNSLFTDWLESDDDLNYDKDKFLTVLEAKSFLKSLHPVPMSKQQKQRLLDIIKEI